MNRETKMTTTTTLARWCSWCVVAIAVSRHSSSTSYVASAFSLPPLSASLSSAAASPGSSAPSPLAGSSVAVAGATGRTGRLVVEELLRRDARVVALVRNATKAAEVLLPNGNDDVEVVVCDLDSADAVAAAVEGCGAAVWCAAGFSDAPGASAWDKIKALFRIVVTPKRSLDAVGVSALAAAFDDRSNDEGRPRVIMLSSAGVTRPSWSEAKKKELEGAADIPIVRLNPFNILNIKAQSEDVLRQSGVDYCIVRPCGLNNDWPANSRPVLSQGDVAVGRVNRRDVATILVDAASRPEAAGKTFEVFTLRGYPPPSSPERAMARLTPDAEIDLDDAARTNYALLQQMLPGEAQDSAALAMGQTYEQYDAGETGRLGERGREDAETAAPQPTS